MSEEEVKETSGGGSKLLLIVGLVIGLGLGGAAVFFMGPGAGQDGDTVEEEVEKEPEDLQVIEFKDILIPIYIQRNGRSVNLGNYAVDLSIEVDGEENAERITRYSSRLKHEFIAVISRDNLMREDNPSELDLEKAGRILTDTSNKVLKKDIVLGVRVTSAQRMSRG